MIASLPLRWLRVFAGPLVFLTAVAVFAASPEPRPLVSPIFGDSMVLQRGKPNPVWGWADAGQAVRVTIADRSAETRAGADGKWAVAIEPPAVGGPYELTIEGKERVVLHDVLVGDVWLCGGQSNMAFTLRGAKDGADEAKSANAPRIRAFTVSGRPAYGAVDLPRGKWVVCTPETAAGISAVGYYFARRLEHELDIPIGLVVSASGGSPAESWMSLEAVDSTGEFPQQVAAIAKLHAEGAPEIGSFLMHWLAQYDAGDKDAAWAQPGFDDHDWTETDPVGAFAKLGVPETPSVVWFRTTVDLPDPLPAGQARLQLGQVEKMDTSYVNGRWVGASSWVENPRNHAIPAGVLKPGRNLIAVRVFKLKPTGGFVDGPGSLRLQFGPPAEGKTIPLNGPWRARLSVDARPPHPLPLDLENYPTMPTVLYNGMIAPLAPLALTGALWYQGEANQTHGKQYGKLMPALVADWRKTFHAPDLPVYLVSLPSFMKRRETPGTSDGWTEVRAAQLATPRTVKNTATVVTIDVGDAANIHPTEKRPVGERLAAVALAKHYGRAVPFAGPTFRGLEPLPGALRLRFDHAEGLTVKGDRLGEFAIAGADRAWHWANAKLDGDTVIVSSPDVAQPVAVRYAWQANPLATLYNGAGFPAEPFRSDDWDAAAAH